MPFLDSLPEVIAGALGFMFRDATLSAPGAKVSDGRGGFNATPVDHACKALVEDYTDIVRAAAQIPMTDRKIIVLGASLPPGIIPVPDHSITVEGRAWRVIAVKRDPAAATYECQAR